MDLFTAFIESLERDGNSDIIDVLHIGYDIFLEAEAAEEAKKEEKPTINKKYLMSLTADEKGELDGSKLKAAKKQAKEFLLKEGFQTLFKNAEQSNIFVGAINFLSKLILQNEEIKEEYVLYFHDLIGDGEKNELFTILQDPEITGNILTEQIGEYNREKEKAARGDLSDEEYKEYMNVKVMHDFNDGWKWVLLLDKNGNPKSRCTIEAKQLGHCGTAYGNEMLYSLRKGAKSGVTVAVNKGTNKIAQSKGRKNSKVNLEKYGKHMLWLFKSNLIKGIDDAGYAPDRNTHVSDFLPIDETIVEYFEQNKPEMISETYDRKVIDIKRKLKTGELQDSDIIKLFERGELKLGLVKGILGGKKFFQQVNEPMVIKWIRNGKVRFEDILQTTTKMFSNEIQKELVLKNPGNYEHFKKLEEVLDTFKINPTLDVWQMKSTRGRSVRGLTSEQQIDIIDKNPDTITELLKISHATLRYFNEDVKLHIVNKMPIMFFDILKTNGDILDEINAEQRIELFRKFPEPFGELLTTNLDVLAHIPPDNRMEILNSYEPLFGKIFENNKNAIKYFPKTERMNIVNKYPDIFKQSFNPDSLRSLSKSDRIEALDKYPDSFTRFFAEDPASIGYFPKNLRMGILDKYADSFAKGFENDIVALAYFPKPNHMGILNKFKDSFSKLFAKEPEAIEYFPEEKQQAIKQHFGV